MYVYGCVYKGEIYQKFILQKLFLAAYFYKKRIYYFKLIDKKL